MGHGIGGHRKSFSDMYQQYSDTAIDAFGLIKPGSKTETEEKKSAGGALQAGLGMGLSGAKAAPFIAKALGASTGGIGAAITPGLGFIGGTLLGLATYFIG